MRIEKIELIGFKSFADKTSFVLHPGITCVVGPNGCGKSNIVDAFRWVLGEQSAKSLRGEKMDEVIFNGSSLKKPKGMAEVTMVISGMNGAGAEQVQGDVLYITRRLYRSGESEYLINKSQCRLKDIKDIFLDTGLDFRSYSILEQGRIGEILNSKPIERRFIIEEVAGVMKYKVRRAEALSKLESSRINLIRINDIIAEVKKQLNILDRLAKKAERYKRLSAEAHAIELKIARKDYQRLTEVLASILEELQGLKEREALMQAELSESENRTESRRVTLLEKEKTLELVQKDFQNLEREIAENERSIAVGRNEVSNLNEYRNRLSGQEEEIDQRSAELSGRAEELRTILRKISDEMEGHADLLREKVETFKAIEDELLDKEELIEDKRRQTFRTSDELSNLRNELGKHRSAFEGLERREASAMKEAEDSRRMLSGIEASIHEVETGIHIQNNEAILLREKKEVLTSELAEARTELDGLSRDLARAREDLASSASRLESLKEIVFDRPTWDLISSQTGVKLVAALSDVIEVDAEHEKAIEAALADRTDSFILGSEGDIKGAVSSLKGKDLGKTAFISVTPPLSPLPSGVPEGVIGRALDLVKIRAGYERVAENLLGGVCIVQDLDAAFSVSSSGCGYSLATLEGIVVEPSGAVLVGGEKGIFRRKREIRELEEMVEEKRTDAERLSSGIQQMQSVVAEREEGIRTVESASHLLEKEISLSKLTVRNYIEEKDRISRKISYLTLESEEVLKEKTSLSVAIGEAEKRITSVEIKKGEIEEETRQLQEGISQKRSEREESRSEVTELRLLNASNKERMEATRNEIESSEKMIEDLRQKRESLQTDRESIFSRITLREQEILELEGKLRKIVADADGLRAIILVKKEEIDQENESLLAVEHDLKNLRQQISVVAARISELDVARAEHKMRTENLTEKIKTDYGMEIETIELLEVTPEDEQRLGELRTKLQEMGPVNLGTLEEYDELAVRYEFMTKQHEDLTRSIAELEEAISRINSTTRKKLREAYETLNAKFKEVFVTLFGGGRAELVLTDESNILETGIEIVAQPPGKRLQNIHLLSGGEKALTALSIQFASFLIKPTPLCILDEADAPLDESNTERYAKMLEGLASHTQFIVITHNRTTMGAAQHLYGITMEEAGVSKVMSMQFAELQSQS